MDTYEYIATQIAIKIPDATGAEVAAATDIIYEHILTSQGTQEVDDFLRKTPAEVKASVQNRLNNHWSILQISLHPENAVINPADLGVLQDFAGLSGIIVYTKP